MNRLGLAALGMHGIGPRGDRLREAVGGRLVELVDEIPRTETGKPRSR